MDTFQRLKVHHHPKVQYRKNLSRMRTLREKNCQRTKTKRNGREKTNKKRERRQKIAAKNQELKRINKVAKYKRDKKEIWARLKELNHNFAKMKEQKNLDNKKKTTLFSLGFIYFNKINSKLILIKNIFCM